jgi:D-alanyl-lipoteichoic acid acyltransferase DltB (MBOAT superfamily)
MAFGNGVLQGAPLLLPGLVAAFYLLYWLLRQRVEAQNTLLLIAGYVVYGAINWRHLILLLCITGITYIAGRLLATTRNKRLVLCSAIGLLLVVLAYFRYAASLGPALAALVGGNISLVTLMPLGISFYSLQAISYMLEVNAGRLPVDYSLKHVALYLSFFPKLPAGPVERPANFLPQLLQPRRITAVNWNTGLWLILLGYLEKKVMADNLAPLVRQVFAAPHLYAGLDIWVAGIAFAFQLYGDFSGYSNMALGAAKLLGFDLTLNFRLPYFATSPNDFWARWHISLSDWLREYVFFPVRRWLVSRRARGAASIILPTVLSMLVSGLWHGPTANYLVWGLYFAMLSILYFYLDRAPDLRSNAWLSGLIAASRVALMFGLVVVGWLIFRAESLQNLVQVFSHLGTHASAQTRNFLADLVFFVAPVVGINFLQAYTQNLLFFTRWPLLLRAFMFAFILCWAIIFSAPEGVEFIYARF